MKVYPLRRDGGYGFFGHFIASEGDRELATPRSRNKMSQKNRTPLPHQRSNLTVDDLRGDNLFDDTYNVDFYEGRRERKVGSPD